MQKQAVNYERIKKSIHYIRNNINSQPTLEEIAAAAHLSPFYFQRIFSEWAGVSPKKFIQYLSITYAKALLKNSQSTLIETASQVGLSGTGRLHDLFINIEGMTPGEYKNGGNGLSINYSYSNTPFGSVLIASTPKGICHLSFEKKRKKTLNTLKQQFPNATYQQQTDPFQQDALRIFQKNWQNLDNIKLHLKGSPFQLKVWESLLSIPFGQLTSYGAVAHQITKPNAARAVGSAIGKNPISFLIPCHRVIQINGKSGGYRWGEVKKSAIIGWEAAKTTSDNDQK